MNLQGGSSSLLQGGNVNPQTPAPVNLQPAINPQNAVDPVDNSSTSSSLGANTSVDPAVTAAAAQAAADAARAASLRGQVSDLVNTIKGIFNTRYGQVDQVAAEQEGKLNSRFGQESSDLAKQVDQENQQIGAAHAAAGTFDSSYRGNNVDTATASGAAQVRDLGQEVQDNIAKIAAWVSQQKTGFDAQKGSYDSIAAHLAEETDPNNLTTLRNQIESQLADLQSHGADYQTSGAATQALESIAPSSARAVQLKTTLQQILGGTADPNAKAAIAQSLITNAGLNPQEQQQLLLAFHSDLNSTAQTDQNNQPVTA